MKSGHRLSRFLSALPVLAVVAIDALTIGVIWATVVTAYWASGLGHYDPRHYLAFWPIVPACLLLNYFHGQYGRKHAYGLTVLAQVEEFRALTISALLSNLLLMSCLGFMHRQTEISRLVIAVSAVLQITFAQPVRNLWRGWLRRRFKASAAVKMRMQNLRPLRDRGRALRTEKAVIEFLLTVGLTILAIPVFVIVPVLIKLDSRGPVFYRARRLGKKGRPITIIKFRTMRKNADIALNRLLASDPTAAAEFSRTFKLGSDPRVTRVGRWLRKTSLDELPQLFNVYLRQLSLIGPRPIVEREVTYYGECFPVFSSVRPGITGLWQCTKRSEVESYRERVALDVYYVQNWSPWMDIWIVYRTVFAVLTMKGAC